MWNVLVAICSSYSLPSAHIKKSFFGRKANWKSWFDYNPEVERQVLRSIVQFLEFSESYSDLEFPKPFQIKCEDHSKLHFIAKFALNTIFRLEIFELPISVDFCWAPITEDSVRALTFTGESSLIPSFLDQHWRLSSEVFSLWEILRA